MAFSLDPAKLITNAVTSLVNSAVLIGMPCDGAPVPLFCLCEFPEEHIHGESDLPGALTQAGEMKTRSVIRPSSVDLSLVLVEHDSKNSEIFKAVQVALTAIAVLINEVASYGTILPSLTGLTSGYVASQISALYQIKNNMQPVMLLSNYFSLGILQQNISYLSSSWYITEIDGDHEGGKDGTVIKLKIKEQFTPRNVSTLQGIASTIASETISPLAGLAVGSLF